MIPKDFVIYYTVRREIKNVNVSKCKPMKTKIKNVINAYYVTSGVGKREVSEIVFAITSDRAKHIFWQENIFDLNDRSVITTKLIEESVNRQEGIASNNDDYWAKV